MAGKSKKNAKSKAASVAAQRRPSTGSDRSTPSPSNRPSHLSDRYQFTPAQNKRMPEASMENLSPPSRGPSQFHVHEYPPPVNLFQTTLTPTPQNSMRHPNRSNSDPREQRRQTFSNPEANPSQSHRSLPLQSHRSPPPQRHPSPPPQSHRSTPPQNSEGQSNNFEEEEDDDDDASDAEAAIDDTAEGEADLEESRLEALNALLRIENRHTIRGITTLSPLDPPPENTTW